MYFICTYTDLLAQQDYFFTLPLLQLGFGPKLVVSTFAHSFLDGSKAVFQLTNDPVLHQHRSLSQLF